MEINFIFIRHGESCQNLLGSEYDNGHIDGSKYRDLFHELYDPTLSSNGLNDSIKSGKILQQTITDTIGNVDLIFASPMLRAIETAHYMSDKTDTIFVSPYLRESSRNKDTNIYRQKNGFYLNYERPSTIDTIKSLNLKFPIKSIREQRKYFASQNINNIDYSFVENDNERLSPGNIEKFIEWFGDKLANESNKWSDNKYLNVLVYIHSHVIKNFASDHPSPYNNFGFILKTKFTENEGVKYSKDDISMFTPDFERSDKMCSDPNRCPGICISNEVSASWDSDSDSALSKYTTEFSGSIDSEFSVF